MDTALEFLTRRGCHLCDEALSVVRSEADRHQIALVVVDIDASPTLTDEYGDRVPVLRDPSGAVLAEGRSSRRTWKRAARG